MTLFDQVPVTGRSGYTVTLGPTRLTLEFRPERTQDRRVTACTARHRHGRIDAASVEWESFWRIGGHSQEYNAALLRDVQDELTGRASLT